MFKFIRILPPFQLMILICTALYSALSAAARDSWPLQAENLPVDPQLVGGVLENGFRYLILPNAEPPQRLSLRLYVGAGALMEEEHQQGLAHFLEHMAFNGTEHFAAGEMVEFFQRIGMAFGADTNAHTGFDETVYKIDLPNLEPHTLEESLRLLRDYADGLLLEPAEIERERGVILAEKLARNSVGYRTFVAYWEFLFPDALMPQRFPIGREEIIRTANRDAFVEFYQKWYRPDNMVLVAVGDCDVDRLRQQIEAAFSDLPAEGAPLEQPNLGRLDEARVAAWLHSEKDAPATEVNLFALKKHSGIKDSLQSRQENLTLAVANRILSRRLERLSRQADADFSAGSAYYFDYLDFFELAAISITCQPDQWRAGVAVAENELRRALQYGFTASELSEVRAVMLNEFRQAVRSADSRRSRQLADQLARSVGQDRVFTSPQTELEIAEQLFADLTLEQVHSAFVQSWSVPGRSLFISGNLELDEAEDMILSHYAEVATYPVEPLEEVVVGELQHGDYGPAAVVVERTENPEIGVVQLRLSNDVRVNLKQTEFEKDTIRVQLRFGDGRLSEPDAQPGLAWLAQAVYVEGGIRQHSYEELQRIIAGKTVGADFTVDQDAFTLGGTTNQEDLLLQLRLLTAYLMEPELRPETLQIAQREFEQQHIAMETSVEGKLRGELPRILAGGDLRFGLPESEALMQRTLEEVAQWLQRPRLQGYLEVSVVGDFAEDEVVEAIRTTLGRVPRRAAKPEDTTELRAITAAATPAAVELVVATEVQRAGAFVYWPTTDWWDIERNRRLGVLADVFMDRLRKELRQQLGEAYSPFAISATSETYTGYGWFFCGAIVDPQVVTSAIDVMLEISQSLSQDGVSEDETARAINPLVNRIKEYQRNNAYWLVRVLADSQRYPQKLDWAQSMLTDYASISAAELSQLAAEYLSPERALQVRIMPASEAE